MNLPLQQTHKWEKLQADLGEQTVFEQTDDYTFLGIVKKSRFGNYLYLPYGPYVHNKNTASACFKALESLSKAKNLIFARIEPQMALMLPKCAKKSTDLNPKETWRLDLTGSEDDLKAKLPSRLLRYFKNAEKKGISIEISKNPADIHYLLGLQKALAAEKKINTFSEKYLATELKQDFATLYLVKYTPSVAENTALDAGSTQKSEKTPEIIAAGLVFDDQTTRYNLQGAQNDTGRQLHATGILTIKLILDAYAKKLQIFDFWGIAPENAPKNHPWAGFTAFKKTFAGYPVEYMGTYDLVYDAKKYRLYQLARKANRTFRKILH